jgi:hypothetical protein
MDDTSAITVNNSSVDPSNPAIESNFITASQKSLNLLRKLTGTCQYLAWFLLAILVTGLFCGSIALIVICVYILNISSEAEHACNSLWQYLLINLCLLCGIPFIFYCLKRCCDVSEDPKNDGNKIFTRISAGTVAIAQIAMFVWSCIIYAALTSDDNCYNFYDDNYHMMLTFFIVTFWISVGFMSLYFSVRCLFGLFHSFKGN